MTTATLQPTETQVTATAEWEVGPLTVSGLGGIPCRDVLVVDIDRFAGGYICNAVDGVAQSIVDNHNSIDSLREENRVLREAAGNLLSVAQKLPQPATVDGLALADALAAVRAALRLGEGRE